MLEKMLIIKFLLQGVPETAAVIFASFALAGYKAKIKELLRWAVIITFIIYLLRIAFWSTGIHNLVGVILLILLLCKITKIQIIPAFCVAFVVNFVLIMTEFIMLKVMSILLNYQLTYQPTNNDWLWIISGWPQIIIMFILGHFIYKYFKPCCFFAGFRR